MIWFKILSALLGLFSLFAGWIERARIRAVVKTEEERNELRKIFNAIQEDRAREDRARYDPAHLDQLRRYYRNRE